MELDVAEWLNIMIMRIGFGVNRSSKEFRFEPDAPASDLDWHPRTDAPLTNLTSTICGLMMNRGQVAEAYSDSGAVIVIRFQGP
jgi:hypothetical protein